MKISNQSGFAHMMIVAAVVVIVAIGGVGYFVFGKNDSKTTKNNSSTNATSSSSAPKETGDQKATKAAAKDHFALVYQKKISEAYQSTCQGFKDNTPYTVFTTSLGKAYFSSVDLSAVEYTSVDVRNNQARISGLMGPVVPGANLKVNLLKENGQWCVFGYKVE